jgi:hypothetical protein
VKINFCIKNKLFHLLILNTILLL